jgi:hypothetical protein
LTTVVQRSLEEGYSFPTLKVTRAGSGLLFNRYEYIGQLAGLSLRSDRRATRSPFSFLFFLSRKIEREYLPSFHIFPASNPFQIFPIILAMHAQVTWNREGPELVITLLAQVIP